MPARLSATRPSATRRQLMAYRIVASGLDRSTRDVGALDLWDIGLQDRDGTAMVALAARLPASHREQQLAGLVAEPADASPFAMAWSLRGSPHLHRRADLQRFADALWPLDEADAQARLVGSGQRLKAKGGTGLAAYAAVAQAMRSVAGQQTLRKSDLSAALTPQVPSEFAGFCEPCGSVHVFEMLFRLAALPAGLGLLPSGKATVQHIRPTVRQPDAQGGLAAILASYLRIYGAATPTGIAQHLGTTATLLRASGALPADLIPMQVDDAKVSTTPREADAIAAADPDAVADLVRLLPHGDPLLQPRERALLIQDRVAWKQLWPAIGPAGAVLAGGEIAGYWRTRKSGRTLTITIGEFRPLSAGDRAKVQDEAQIVGAVRGTPGIAVVFPE